MPGLIIGGRVVDVPGCTVRNYKDDPKLALRVGMPDGQNDGRKRTKSVSLVVLHTTKGIPGGSDKRPQLIKPGFGPDTKAEERTVRYWSTDPKQSGAHLVVDHDGTIGCLADLRDVCAYHAGQSEVNDRAVGIEIYQGNDAELYEEQLNVVRKLVDVLTSQFGIQRQIPLDYNGHPVDRLVHGGKNCVGVVGHRDVSDRRSKGDPGDAVFTVLEKAGYERVNYRTGQDLELWKVRQQKISHDVGRVLAIDGIPGPATVSALRDLGYVDGLWAAGKTPAESTTASAMSLIEQLLGGFLPIFLAAVGSKEKAIEAIQTWLDSNKDS